ncbi:hypothetical protein [Phytoactinopolyspora endophytica]|uniref:hypothetical protein n=1 Tax=Phytoactinopolyspora endophytica TaxID=1642495 RepID=UPI003B838A8F
MCRQVIETHLHALRDYSATELIADGVDVRTVAGRLGHGGGGATTLRVYTAWLNEADQRAAQALAECLPPKPEAMSRAESVRGPIRKHRMNALPGTSGRRSPMDVEVVEPSDRPHMSSASVIGTTRESLSTSARSPRRYWLFARGAGS